MKTMKKILIVDDIELNRAILGELFRMSYEIVEAENGRQALTLLAESRDDIVMVLLDIVMPVMDGFEVLRQLNERGWIQSVPVIMITAEDKENISLQSYELGVSDVIQKPFDINVVKRRVENVIELYRYRHDLEETVRQQTEELKRQAMRLQQTNLFMMDALSTVVEFRDCNSGEHVQRVRDTTLMFLQEIIRLPSFHSFTPEQVEAISNASTVHDIGKIAIPDYILNKPGKLTAEEFEVMKTHTTKGGEIIQSLHLAPDDEYYIYCYDICRYHHEKWDGNGYPDGLKGDEIPIWAQVVSLADVYDALVNERVYKPAYSHSQAMTMILGGECGQFNPLLLDCLRTISDKLRQLYQTKESADAVAAPAAAGPWQAPFETSDRLMQLLELEQKKHQFFTYAPGEIIFDYDPETDQIVFNERYKEIFGRDFQVGGFRKCLPESSLLYEDDRVALMQLLDKCTSMESTVRSSIRLRTAAGSFDWFEITAHSLWDFEHDVCRNIVGKLVDINDLKEETEHWRTLAQRDALTGLVNRSAFQKQVEKALEENPGQTAAIFFLDVDNFKEINDQFGHQFGDMALQCVAQRLASCFRKTDVIGRIGGDEFVIFIRGLEKEPLEKKLKQLMGRFAESFNHDKLSCKLSVSIGVALYPLDGVTYNELIEKSDRTLYYIKNNGKGSYCFYDARVSSSPFRSMITLTDSQALLSARGEHQNDI